MRRHPATSHARETCHCAHPTTPFAWQHCHLAVRTRSRVLVAHGAAPANPQAWLYKLVCQPTGRLYIGQTLYLDQRYAAHAAKPPPRMRPSATASA